MPAPLEQRFTDLPVTEHGDGLVIVEARTHRARRRGLSRLDELHPDHALLLPQCLSVHTFGMRFALDLIWLHKDGTVIRVDHDVAPRRMKLCSRARTVIETASGRAEAFLAAGVGTGATAG